MEMERSCVLSKLEAHEEYGGKVCTECLLRGLNRGMNSIIDGIIRRTKLINSKVKSTYNYLREIF